MLNQETKRKIDNARDILVGKVPDPKAQVEQITTALIYKFMDDMDKESIEVGGKARFFSGEYEKYAWSKLLDTKLGGQDRANLYVEALGKFSQNQNIPEIFRKIFKDAFLPYRDSETLNLFLKEVNGFSYDHSEDLGDAYEYLLSVLGSQGDAGQFRTPRHIIDFIVEVLDPQKTDTILDPACGTAGFLISAYKHILKQHDGLDENGKPNKEKILTPDERKQLINNFTGYDISPDMVRISLVNMYLHGFQNPKIFEYDTLTSEDKWEEHFDVILANPPFMTPKGGIRPHKRFSVQASRSEVLFVNYIVEHLKQNGKAGIIVPESIISQNGNAYKQLRKLLLNNGLIAVISLPAGVFNPYSGVKTSILLLDSKVAKSKDELLFIKIENDGFDLGAQRKKKNESDLPNAIETIKKWIYNEKVSSNMTAYIDKQTISKNAGYSFSSESYMVEDNHITAKYNFVKFEDVTVVITPTKKLMKKDYLENGDFPIIDQSQESISGWTNDISSLINIKKPLVIFGDHTCVIKYSERKFAQGADGIKIIQTKDILLPKYLYYLLKIRPIKPEGYKRHFTKLKSFKFPLPPLVIQSQIVTVLDNYQSMIDSATKILEVWAPSFTIDSQWTKQKISDVCDVFSGGTPSRGVKEYWDGPIPWISSKYFSEDNTIVGYEGITKEGLDNSSSKIAPKGSTILITRVSVGKYAYADQDYAINQDLMALLPKTPTLNNQYLYIISKLIAAKIKINATGLGVVGVTKDFVLNQQIPIPPIQIQLAIVDDVEKQQNIMNANRNLIKIYKQKMSELLATLWEDN